jgi:hypothetical protein
MTFAFNPDGRPPRLMRYVEPGTLPGRDLLCVYDYANNLLIINQELFAQLSSVDQSQVLRTQRTSITMAELGYPGSTKEAA